MRPLPEEAPVAADADYNAHEHDEQLVDSLIVHPAADGLADYAAESRAYGKRRAGLRVDRAGLLRKALADIIG